MYRVRQGSRTCLLLARTASYFGPHFGVPQERKRVIAGNPALVSRMQGRADPLSAPRVMDVIPDRPALAVGIKGRRATLGREHGIKSTQRLSKHLLTRSLWSNG